MLLLIAAPEANGYYPKIGFEQNGPRLVDRPQVTGPRGHRSAAGDVVGDVVGSVAPE